MSEQNDDRTVSAEPTKAFFVDMLTRDIELADAILDLLDNCVDGILRDLGKEGLAEVANEQQPYAGRKATITATPDQFRILDNCGGIPVSIAERSAFRFGRPDGDRERDGDLPTVGMYGIGMKRAMFKMGRSCEVVSRPDGETYTVKITPEWLKSDDWFLRLLPGEGSLDERGTSVTVTDLHPSIRGQFTENDSSFLRDLRRLISRHYAVILGKGFSVELNGVPVEPVALSLLFSQELKKKASPQIEPYMFVGTIHAVEVKLAVGFYRQLASEQELDENARKSTRENAGWTVICNDRIVLYNDKSAKTGWGFGGVPSYHGQFISIAGVVSFRSEKSALLPLTTTKRGLDASSEVYFVTLGIMQEGLKKFTSFTNAWKKKEEQTNEGFASLTARDPRDVWRDISTSSLSRMDRIKKHGEGFYHPPNLPKPKDRESRERLTFLAERVDVERVAAFLLEDPRADRPSVGRACFDRALEDATDGELGEEE